MSSLWHLQQFHSHDMVTSLPKVSCSDGVFPSWALGKQHQDPFPKGKYNHASSLLELEHSDLMIFFFFSFTGARYALNFIDDFSRCT